MEATAAAAADEQARKKPKLSLDDAAAAAAAETTATTTPASGAAVTVLAAPLDSSSAVTALAVWEETKNTTIIFSGHRNGTIRRWDVLVDNDNSNDSSPRWCIPSCADLTRDPTYGALECLGVAGLVVRQRTPPPNNNNDDESTDLSLLLYSWNHQREDMRATNGIPNKVMIWNGGTGARCAALMIDVGRGDTGAFANPLPSCLVFAPLLLVTETAKTKTKTTATEDDKGKPAAVSLKWTDTILVGLQATCTEPTAPVSKGGDNKAADREDTKPPAAAVAAIPPTPAPPRIVAAGGQTLPPAIAAKLGMVGAAQQNRQQPTTTTTAAAGKPQPTGNLLPFCEQSRKRLQPWIAPGGFVRALACIPKKYVIGITETTVPTATASQSADEKADPPAPSSSTSSTSKKAIGGGQASEIILWDATKPGTILHKLKLWNGDDCTATNPPLRGNVFGLWRSSFSQNEFVVACRSETESNNGWTALVQTRIHGEPAGNSGAKGSSNDGEGTTTATLSMGKSVEIDTLCSAAASAGNGDLVALAETHSKDVLLYNNLSEQARESLLLPSNDEKEGPVTTSGPNTLVVAGSSTSKLRLIAGYANGLLLLQQLAAAATQQHPTDSNEPHSCCRCCCCSTAPPGLQGMLCPNLTAASNSVQLQNQCAIQ